MGSVWLNFGGIWSFNTAGGESGGWQAVVRYGDEREACGRLISQNLNRFPFVLQFRSVEFRHIPRIHNEVANAFATLASMLRHPDKAYVDPLHIQVRDQHAYCNVVEEELDGEPWFHDIREYIRMGVYLIQATGDQKRKIRHLASGFFLS
ncbi:PREDICTED: uncharacterized protein LOC109224468 [Nicotiana attenuata]|uniref:uncharacterized protein LOC109224468 n=1 Tax=Nicotiana attenuata TaxID=49451 RepID=UPI00090496AA|nr:PREDICTED: uncharacterized protein LOC109224468 [Nicotiana attenuata]